MSTSGPHVDAPIAPHRYGARLAAEIEQRWQDRWESEGTFHADNPVGDLASGAELPAEKYFLMDMFPYPSKSRVSKHQRKKGEGSRWGKEGRRGRREQGGKEYRGGKRRRNERK